MSNWYWKNKKELQAAHSEFLILDLIQRGETIAAQEALHELLSSDADQNTTACFLDYHGIEQSLYARSQLLNINQIFEQSRQSWYLLQEDIQRIWLEFDGNNSLPDTLYRALVHCICLCPGFSQPWLELALACCVDGEIGAARLLVSVGRTLNPSSSWTQAVGRLTSVLTGIDNDDYYHQSKLVQESSDIEAVYQLASRISLQRTGSNGFTQKITLLDGSKSWEASKYVRAFVQCWVNQGCIVSVGHYAEGLAISDHTIDLEKLPWISYDPNFARCFQSLASLDQRSVKGFVRSFVSWHSVSEFAKGGDCKYAIVSTANLNRERLLLKRGGAGLCKGWHQAALSRCWMRVLGGLGLCEQQVFVASYLQSKGEEFLKIQRANEALSLLFRAHLLEQENEAVLFSLLSALSARTEFGLIKNICESVRFKIAELSPRNAYLYAKALACLLEIEQLATWLGGLGEPSIAFERVEDALQTHLILSERRKLQFVDWIAVLNGSVVIAGLVYERNYEEFYRRQCSAMAVNGIVAVLEGVDHKPSCVVVGMGEPDGNQCCSQIGQAVATMYGLPLVTSEEYLNLGFWNGLFICDCPEILTGVDLELVLTRKNRLIMYAHYVSSWKQDVVVPDIVFGIVSRSSRGVIRTENARTRALINQSGLNARQKSDGRQWSALVKRARAVNNLAQFGRYAFGKPSSQSKKDFWLPVDSELADS